MTPTGLPEEAIQSFSGYTLSLIVGLAKVFFGCRAFFKIVFALCGNLLRLLSRRQISLLCARCFTPLFFNMSSVGKEYISANTIQNADFIQVIATLKIVQFNGSNYTAFLHTNLPCLCYMRVPIIFLSTPIFSFLKRGQSTVPIRHPRVALIVISELRRNLKH